MISLAKKARNLLDKIRKGSKQVIDHDDFDLENFKKIKERSKVLLDTEELALKDYEQFPELMQDAFDALFKNNPELLEDWQIKTDYLLNREIAQKLMESARYKELRVLTQLDEMTSALATETMSEQLLEWVKELKEQRQALQDMVDAANDLNDAVGDGNGEGGGEGEEDGEEDKDGKKGKGNKKISVEEAMKKLEEAKANFQASTEAKQFKQGIERIAAKVKDTVRETSDMISNWGLENSNSYTTRPVNEKMELLNKLRNSEKLKQIAKLAGRYRRMALQVRKERVKKGLDEHHSIMRGKDLSHLVSTEWLRLKHPLTRKLFKSDFVEGKTLIYEIKGKETKAKGPIIICIDSSGSMSGLPEIWAKSVALALLEIAREQKRDFFVIHFSAERGPDELKTNEFLKDKQFEVEEMIDMAEFFIGGGTLFEPPLDLSRIKIGSTKQWSKADIIFVTDGESAVTPKWLEEFNAWKKENKVNISSILIDSGWSSVGVLNLFSDRIEKLSNMKQDADDLAVSIFANI